MRRAVTALRTARRATTFRRFCTFQTSNTTISRPLRNAITPLSLTTRRYSSTGPMRAFRTLPRGPVATVGAFAAAICAYQIWSPASPSSSLTQQATFTSEQTRAASTVPSTDRKALVVDNDQFFTGAIIGDGPLAKSTDDRGRKVLEMLSPEQATAHIRRNEQSYLVGRGRGVVRYDTVQLPSNDPIEDDKAEKIIEVPFGGDWMFWGVFDGHSGWTTSAKLRQALISFAARELNTTYKSAQPTPPAPSAVDAALKSAFLKLDNEICNDSVDKLFKDPSRTLGAEILAPALSGSCALLTFYDSATSTLRVACTGDSRAVLGRKNAKTGKWFATPLSEDQTGSNPAEEARMRAEHPGEPQVIYRGRVLGNLEPTRAFGDAAYKWSRDVQEKIKAKFWGRSLNPLLKTPPYVTAEPVVTSTQIQPAQGDFVVLATDGLWEMLSNEEVVGLVGQWVETQKTGSSSWLSMFQGKKGLPVEKGGNMDKSGGGKGDTPIRQQQWSMEGGHERFVVEDKNAATHLVRNALGGRDRDMVSALLTLPSPYSRRYRDDLTVEVIFFGEAEGDGKIRVNEEATAKDDLKAKL